MIFRNLTEDNGWMIVEYSATWRYGYDFMLDAAQTIIETDFKERLQRVAISEVIGAPDVEVLEEVKAQGNILRSCDRVKEEHGTLTVSGISRIMNCPIQFVFFNQTNIVRLFCPIKKMFDEHGEHVFDNYVNSVEIKAYCKDTERRTIENMKK